MGRDRARRMMHAALGGVLAALCGCDSVVASREPRSQPPALLAERVPAPALAFTAPGGAPLTLQSFVGRVAVVSVWATWCAPCLGELTSLDRLAARMPSVAVVPVNVNIDPAAAHAWFARLALVNLASYQDHDGQALRTVGVRGLPAAIIVDPDGRVAAVVHGAVDWTSAAMLDLLRRVGEREDA